MSRKLLRLSRILIAAVLVTGIAGNLMAVRASGDPAYRVGGGYAASGQIEGVGYTAKLYDSTNGLPTSEANCVLCSSDGYIWIGGYSGIIKYDGVNFERITDVPGLTSGRAIYEDHLGRIWVGTNDNGVVVVDGTYSRQFTKADGLPSASVRAFAEDGSGNMFIGTSSGMAYITEDLLLRRIDDDRINEQRILNLVSDVNDNIYGLTKTGSIFRVTADGVAEFHTSDELGTEKIDSIIADPEVPGTVYLGTDSNVVYHGSFGAAAADMERTDTGDVTGISCLYYGCGRLWLANGNVTGYINDDNELVLLENLPVNANFEMITSDYQGNMWFASSRNGVMKVITNNFLDYTDKAGLVDVVVNATCLQDGILYAGTDDGLYIVDEDGLAVSNRLTDYLEGIRIRHIMADSDGNLWMSTFSSERGLVCVKPDGRIISYRTGEGMPNNEVRCTWQMRDGSIAVGTNNGIAVIEDGDIVRTYGSDDGISNTVILTLCEGDDGHIVAGSDGDGIYIIDGQNVSHIGTDDGLTSDVVLRIRKDERRDLYWIVTSNSIEYLKDGVITEVTSFPYNNNFEIIPDHGDDLWVLSSLGVFVVSAEDMIDDSITEYRLYNVANGLTSVPVANCYSAFDDEGYLYISGQSGVSRVNIDNYFELSADVKTGIRRITFDDEVIYPDENGTYTIPQGSGRIQIIPAVMDYTLSNPTVQVYLEGIDDAGITLPQSELTSLEYTRLSYGSYVIHIRLIDRSTGQILSDSTFNIVKKPQLFERTGVRIGIVVLLALAAGFIVWRFMKGTIVKRQYLEIEAARDDAHRANSAKTKFLANMSHEIRMPLNTIVGMDDMILREDQGEDHAEYAGNVRKYAHDIKLASESLLVLINDLLDISKIETGRITLDETEYSPEKMLREIIAMTRERCDDKKLAFNVEIDETTPVLLYGDGIKIRQIIINLLNNAVNFTEEGSVTLSVKVIDKTDAGIRLRISVKDTGIGIKEEDVKRIFNAYDNFDDENMMSVKGSGLGLDISKSFATLMGGDLICDSVYGKGTEFVLTVSQKIADTEPIGLFEEREEETGERYLPSFIAPDADVFIVTPDASDLKILKGLLKPTKIFVSTGKDGKDLVGRVRHSDFDLVFVDESLPDMDVKDAVRQIREAKPDIPVYVMTSGNSGDDGSGYISQGFTGTLSKPVVPERLEKIIMSHLPDEIMLKPRE